MSRSRIREFERREYRDPETFLRALRKVELEVSMLSGGSREKALRTNGLKEWREAREAALFCYGMSQRLGYPIYMSKGEAQDYDFVASWVAGSERHYAPVQLKEVVPAQLSSDSDLESIIASLPASYPDSEDLTVAIHLNRQGRFELGKLAIPQMRLAGLWVFGGISPDQSEWALWGNFLQQPEGSHFTYPA